MAALLEHYGLIGDATTVALVSRAGSLDWLCLPRIDSDACFAKLLGTDDHGYWTIRPATEVRAVARRYRPDFRPLIEEISNACSKRVASRACSTSATSATASRKPRRA